MFARPIGLILLLATLGCQKVDSSAKPAPIDLSQRKARILATTGMIADAAQEIGGDSVDVTCLIGQQDPHSFQPVASDRDLLDRADLILYNGLHLEGKMTDVFEEMARKVRTVAVAEAIDLKDLRQGDGDVEHDPHVWFDVKLWSKAVERIRDSLCELNPAKADQFKKNAADYLGRLAKLDEEIRKKIDELPKEKRILVTAHDAFGYFGRAYGFDVHGLQGVSTATDIGSKDVTNLAKLIGQKKIPTIFGETSVPDRSILSVQQAVSRDWKYEVKLAQTKLFSDALGDPGTPTGNYIGMVRHNVETIVAALK